MSVEQPGAGQKRVPDTPEEKRAAPRRVRNDSVSQLETDDYVCIEPTTTLTEAIKQMREDEGGCAIICEEGSIKGIFTERDLITKVVGEEVDMNAPVSRYMTQAVETLSMDATIGDAVELMNRKGYRNIPLVRDGQLQGSISVFDIITYLAESYPKETMNLPPVPAQVMDTQEGG
ncbi:MAG TPA: CBS domain-containing protein [Pyrinomonadaceae bacterium]|nr:CBS domain-containing protein [Pyrinomonadaceae bacterium]